MKKALQFIATIIYYLLYPIDTIGSKGSERCRVVIFSSNDKVAVLTPWLSDGHWHLPGGGIRKKEDPGEGAKREVEEELGLSLSLKQLKFIKQVKFNARGFKWDIDIFKVKLDDEPPLSPRWHEISHAQWVDPSELNEKNASPDLLICLKNCYNRDYV